jgi:hypothetical protein
VVVGLRGFWGTESLESKTRRPDCKLRSFIRSRDSNTPACFVLVAWLITFHDMAITRSLANNGLGET